MRSKLNKAFNTLRKMGYFAKQDFWCCQTCGWANVPEEFSDKAVFYHRQDTVEKIKGNPFYIAWSGDGHDICKIFNENGITTNWDGSKNKRIQLSNYR